MTDRRHGSSVFWGPQRTKSLQTRVSEVAAVIDGLSKRAEPYGGPRADLDRDPVALAAALDTLRMQHEELLVADEELRAQLEELRGLEAAFARERARADALFHDAPELSLVTDRAGMITDANGAARRLFEAYGLAVVGKPLATITHRDDLPTLHGLANEAARGSVAEGRFRVRPCGGDIDTATDAVVAPFRAGTCLLWRLRPLREAEQDAGVVGPPSSELTRERAARLEEERAHRDKDRLIALVSHDLRGPLNAILGWNDLVRHSPDDLSIRERAFAAIAHAGEQQVRLVEDLLDVTRLSADKLRIERRPVDLVAIVRSSLEAIGPNARGRGIDLGLATEAGVLTVAGDASRLRQVFDNLLGNAVKFTSSGGHVRVVIASKGGQVSVSVRDDGKGIAPSTLPHVFECFRQESTGATAKSGLGLGLYISRAIASLHDGALVAASDGEGHGTTLTFSMPLAAAPFDARVEHSANTVDAVSQSLAGLRVLVVDDDPDACELARFAIRRAGGLPTVATSADAAIERAADVAPHVVVSDIRMQGENDGHRLVRALRRSEHSDVPAIALSANASSNDIREALAAGFDAYLVKPLAMDELVAAIAQAVHRIKPVPG